MLINGDAIQELKKMKPNSVDIVLTDVPYGIGSKLYVRSDGAVDYMKSTDFMNRWEQPNGDYWREWFQEVKRVLKFGGKCVVFGFDNQTIVWQYYALLAGFKQAQSLYWLYIHSKPKGYRTNRSTQIRFGKDSALSKKYDGYYNGLRPFKHLTETIMVFQKEHKFGNCIDDIVAYENSDDEITPSCVNIDGNKIPVKDLKILKRKSNRNSPMFSGKYNNGKISFQKKDYKRPEPNGRYPSTLIVDSKSAESLANQGIILPHEKFFCIYDTGKYETGGMLYVKKPMGKERNEHAEKIDVPAIKDGEQITVSIYASHLTIKPVELMIRLIRLFMPPVKRYVVVDPFVGSGTTLIACLEIDGVEGIGIEIDPEYYEIAKKRIDSHREKLKNDGQELTLL